MPREISPRAGGLLAVLCTSIVADLARALSLFRVMFQAMKLKGGALRVMFLQPMIQFNFVLYSFAYSSSTLFYPSLLSTLFVLNVCGSSDIDGSKDKI